MASSGGRGKHLPRATVLPAFSGLHVTEANFCARFDALSHLSDTWEGITRVGD